MSDNESPPASPPERPLRDPVATRARVATTGTSAEVSDVFAQSMQAGPDKFAKDDKASKQAAAAAATEQVAVDADAKARRDADGARVPRKGG